MALSQRIRSESQHRKGNPAKRKQGNALLRRTHNTDGDDDDGDDDDDGRMECKRVASQMVPGAGLPARGGRAVFHASTSKRDVSACAKRKVITNDKAWEKGLGSVGIFLEDDEKKSFSLVGRLADRKVLSSVEKSGLLSAAEKAGLTLTKVENLKLLSTAEKLGVLALVEDAFAKDGATISSYSIPFLLGAIASLILIPTDNAAVATIHWAAVAACFAGFTTLFVGGFVIKGLQEDD